MRNNKMSRLLLGFIADVTVVVIKYNCEDGNKFKLSSSSHIPIRYELV